VKDLFLDSVTVSETDMVLLAAKGNPKGVHTVQDLTKPDLRVGLADPQKSALGALCDRMLDRMGIKDAVLKNVKTFTATADFLVTDMRAGALDAAIVYRANTSKVGDSLEVFSIDNPAAKAVQPFATGKESKHKQLASRLLAAITSASAGRQFESAGFRFLAGSTEP
ncbi:MAG: substrate-binding domain-containing protein, partial [Planctomycetes bacterium]|nr:substrate-binding domain-containing protein [Planctomycetota bacterium]